MSLQSQTMAIHQPPPFEIALEAQQQGHGLTGVGTIPQCTLQDLFEEIKQVERLHKERWVSKHRIRSRLGHLVTFVDRYSKAVDCLVQCSSGMGANPAMLVWGLLRVLLEVSRSWRIAKGRAIFIHV